ncbi:hypothetical protein LINPERHAP1_LOCUS31972 [Linum perenne]
MEMKKVACAAVVFAAATMSAVLAEDSAAPSPAFSPVAGGPGAAAEGPGAAAGAPASGGAAGVLPALGSMVGAAVVSFVACYFQ